MKKSKKFFGWNKVAPASKYLTILLFIFLTFIGFVLGMKYQLILTVQNKKLSTVNSTPQSNTNSPNFSDWVFLENKNIGISFSHPKDWVVENNSQKIKLCPPGYNGICFSIQPTKLSYSEFVQEVKRGYKENGFAEGLITVGSEKDIQAMFLWTDNAGYYFLNGYINNVIISHSFNDSRDINSVGAVLVTVKFIR